MASLVESFLSSVVGDPNVQARAVAAAINVVMGFTPSIVSGNGYAEIVFTPEQEDIAVAYLNRLIGTGPAPASGGVPATSSTASKVRINIKMIMVRVFLKNYWYVLAGPFMGGFLTGRRTAKRGK